MKAMDETIKEEGEGLWYARSFVKTINQFPRKMVAKVVGRECSIVIEIKCKMQLHPQVLYILTT